MNYIIFEGDLTVENTQSLFNKITEKDDDTIIYFSCNGGECYLKDYFIDFTYRYEKNITLISNWQLASSGFDIFMFSKTRKIVLNGCYGLAHLARREITTIDYINPSEEDKLLMEDINFDNKIYEKKYKKIGFTKQELIDYTKGIDVILNFDRIKSLSSEAEKIIFDKGERL